MFEDAEIISSYTRAQALADGVLFDVSETAKEAGWKYPTAITAHVQGLIDLAVDSPRYCNDNKGVLWDILFMAKFAKGEGQQGLFKVIIKGVRHHSNNHHEVELKVHCSPGDAAEPVLTIMGARED